MNFVFGLVLFVNCLGAPSQDMTVYHGTLATTGDISARGRFAITVCGDEPARFMPPEFRRTEWTNTNDVLTTSPDWSRKPYN